MEIKGYKFITGKKVPRPWGMEYRFTVEKEDKTRIDDVIILPKEDLSEQEVAPLVEEFLSVRDAPIPPEEFIDPIEQAKAEKEEEIRVFLVGKGLLEEGKTVWEIDSKEELLEKEIIKMTPY